MDLYMERQMHCSPPTTIYGSHILGLLQGVYSVAVIMIDELYSEERRKPLLSLLYNVITGDLGPVVYPLVRTSEQIDQ